MRLEGFDTREIAERVGRCRRTVERVLHEFRDRLCEG
jgi:DNA-directed RNA polymerase specialized sigma24 family protein